MPPFSLEIAHEIAFTPLGQHSAPAIVVTALFGCFLLAAIANWLWTKYTWHDVLVFSLALRTVAIAFRAVFTIPGKYHPAYEGIFLAFSNAGYGANQAALLFGVGTWLGVVGTRFYAKQEACFYRIFAYILCFCIICFGPIIGVIAAGIEFGDYNSKVTKQGEACRVTASYGLVAVNFAAICLTLRIMFTVFVTRSKHADATKATATEPATQPRLVALYFLCFCLLAVRGSTGVVAIYPAFEQYWVDDYRFYSLDTFPEFCTALICCWPALYARMAQQWPKSTGSKDGDADPEKQASTKDASASAAQGNETGKQDS